MSSEHYSLKPSRRDILKMAGGFLLSTAVNGCNDQQPKTNAPSSPEMLLSVGTILPFEKKRLTAFDFENRYPGYFFTIDSTFFLETLQQYQLPKETDLLTVVVTSDSHINGIEFGLLQESDERASIIIAGPSVVQIVDEEKKSAPDRTAALSFYFDMMVFDAYTQLLLAKNEITKPQYYTVRTQYVKDVIAHKKLFAFMKPIGQSVVVG